MADAHQAVVTTQGLQALLDALKRRGFRVVGPTVRDAAIVYDDIDSIADLPRGWTDEQDGGRYRLHRRDDEALFGYAVGPQSWRRFLQPPTQRLWSATRNPEGVTVTPEPHPAEKLAFIGARSCELHAIAIQDRVLMGGAYVDAGYRSRREGVFTVAVNCGTAGGTCFCVSMHTGPKATLGYDLALTELIDGAEHRFLVDVGSDDGHAVLAELPQRTTTGEDRDAAAAVVARTAGSMGRSMRSDDVRELLKRNLEHPRWDEVAERCLSCGNSTLVCPTCFCSDVTDVSDVDGTVERRRSWASCFDVDHSYLHGGPVRPTTASRYRQWLTHKLSTWWDQFDTTGCVGCGRCITWCPVGIDITEEVAAIRATASEGP